MLFLFLVVESPVLRDYYNSTTKVCPSVSVVESPVLRDYYNYTRKPFHLHVVVEGPILRDYYNIKEQIVRILMLWKVRF